MKSPLHIINDEMLQQHFRMINKELTKHTTAQAILSQIGKSLAVTAISDVEDIPDHLLPPMVKLMKMMKKVAPDIWEEKSLAELQALVLVLAPIVFDRETLITMLDGRAALHQISDES